MLVDAPTELTTFTWVYGDAKRVKTSSLAAAMPTALWVGPAPSAIESVCRSEYGIEPAIWETPATTFDELWPVLESMEPYASEYGALCIDDLSLMAVRQVNIWKTQPEAAKSNWWPYQMLATACGNLAAWGRYMGVHVAVTSHMREAGYDDKGKFTPGGPDLSGRSPVKKMPGWCDIMARADLNPDYPDPWLAENGCGVAWCVRPFDKQFVTGDRNGICWDQTPPRLREILRASPTAYYLPRLVGLEWQDAVADEAAERILRGDSVASAIQAIATDRAVTMQGADRFLQQRYLRWALQDGIARAVIMLRDQRGLFDVDRIGAAGIADNIDAMMPSATAPSPLRRGGPSAAARKPVPRRPGSLARK